MLHRESWIFILGVKRSKVKVTRHKNSAVVGAGFFWFFYWQTSRIVVAICRARFLIIRLMLKSTFKLN